MQNKLFVNVIVILIAEALISLVKNEFQFFGPTYSSHVQNQSDIKCIQMLNVFRNNIWRCDVKCVFITQSAVSIVMIRIAPLLLIVLVCMQTFTGEAFLFRRHIDDNRPGLVGQLHQISRRSAQMESDDAEARIIPPGM